MVTGVIVETIMLGIAWILICLPGCDFHSHYLWKTEHMEVYMWGPACALYWEVNLGTSLQVVQVLKA